jgi:alpha-mannosidase
MCKGLGIGFERVRSLCTKANVQDLWEGVLLNQFHDVIPGSSIGMVYKDAHECYQEVLEQARLVREMCVQVLAQELDLSPSFKVETDSQFIPPGTAAALKGLCVVNTCGFERRGELVRIPKEYLSRVKLGIEDMRFSAVHQNSGGDVLIPMDVDPSGRPTVDA